MFTSGGQLDLHTFAGLRGGGKGGGGGGGAPPPQTYTDPVSGMSFTDDPYWPGSGAKKLNEEIAQRKAQEQQDAASKAQTATTQATTQENQFVDKRQQAYDAAMQQAVRSFQLQGVDPSAYMASDIAPALQGRLSSIQDLDPNPSAAFPTNLGDTIVNQVTGGKRTQALNALNQTFTPNYSNNLIPDSLTSQYAGDLVNEQFNPLSQQLTNAQKRGTLTGAGYQAAMDLFNQKKSAAMSTVGDLGKGIIASDRSGLNDYISGARSDANALNLGTTFDPSTYAGTAAGRAQTDIGNFGGALRNAIGGTKFADISELINAGGAVQGANNPSAANPTGTPDPAGLSSAYVPPDQLAQQKRGLGSAGAF